MFMILAHHFVTIPLYYSANGDYTSFKALFLTLFGLWGKTGINCFLMITGYFMCKSDITLRKFLKLILEIMFYHVVIFGVMLLFGQETISPMRLLHVIMPVWGFETNFTSCFIGFWLTIPFLNILLHNMNKYQHLLLVILLLGMYTILGSIPTFKVSINYVSWFAVIYIVAAYIRLYPSPLFDRKRFWGIALLVSLLIASLSIIFLQYRLGEGPFFVSDSNKIMAVVVAICSFLYFKNLKIPYSKTINLVGASTFGVLLIHTNSSIYKFLWFELCHCDTLFFLPTASMIGIILLIVCVVFATCSFIDIIRIKTIETPLLNATESMCLSLYNKIKTNIK